MARGIMNLLPNHEHAIIEDSKLIHYALNPRHELGQHKARVFESTLGFNLSNWTQLKEVILDALPHHEATLTSETVFGKKFEMVLPITGLNGRTVDVMTVWQFDCLEDRTLSDVPRLVTVYVLPTEETQ